MKKIFYTILGLGLGLGLTAYAAAPIVFPVNGGTGTSTIPTYGNVLVGNAGGTYTLTATSSLGISGGSGTSHVYYATTTATTAYLSASLVAGNVISITGNACATTGTVNPSLNLYTSNFNATSTVDGGSGGSSGINAGEYLFATYTATTTVTIEAQVTTGGFACTAAGGSSGITKLSVQVLPQ